MKWLKNSNQTIYYYMRTEFVEFESEILHPLLKMYPKNNRFNIPLWIPEEKETPPKGIVIMINGFLEGMGETKVKRDKSLKLYSSIAEKLC